MKNDGYTVIEPTEETIMLADAIRKESLEMMTGQKNRVDKKPGDEQLDRHVNPFPFSASPDVS